MLVTVLGSCRQYGIRHHFPTTSVQENISYTHYTKEILQVIYYCKYGTVNPEETIYTFRSPILHKTPIIYNTRLLYEFNTTDLFIVEIASKKSYKYNDKYLHGIAIEEKYGVSIRNDIIQTIQTKEEIEQDILKMNELLDGKIIIVGHLVTTNSGERFILKEWLEEICRRHKILFIDPISALKKEFNNIEEFFVKEDNLSHYTDAGHAAIGKIYRDFIINNFLKRAQGQ